MATSQAQIKIGTTLKFNGEGDADVAFSMEGVTDGNGRVSAQYDLGLSPRNYLFNWYAEGLLQATPTAGTSIDFFVVGAPDIDSTMIAGDVGAADAALTGAEEIVNLLQIGSLVVDTADTSKQVTFGTFEHTSRYLSIVGINNTGATINATDSNFIFLVTLYNIQGQGT